MPVISSEVLDNGLTALGATDEIHICYAEPRSFTEGASTYSLGKRIFTGGGGFGSPMTDVARGGRKVMSVAFEDGVATTASTALFWAAIDTVGLALLATGSLATYQQVGSGEAFSLPSFAIGMLAQ
jgi:hypothetical protein